MRTTTALALAAGLALTGAAPAQTIFHNTPDWISADTPVSTGAALIDVDHDGWLDLVVANGNDMAEEHLAVYYNRGDGTYPPQPDWHSSDFVYNGHLDVADVNGDGWLDVAVATLGEFNTHGPVARVYLNNEGTLSSLPDWSANIIGNAFGVAFGDMNNDGRPDLAVATGWSYSPQHYYHNLVYANENGVLASAPSWQSAADTHHQGAVWVDGDDDGWLDLAAAASRDRCCVYRNLGGMLETSPSWTVTDASNQDTIMVAAGDINGDGLTDLMFADNNQIAGGTGRFRQYDGIAGGLFETTASWTYWNGYCSAVALADIDSDRDLDLLTGAWFDYTRLFLNTGDGLPSNYYWRSNVDSTIEKIVLGDIDKNGLRPTEAVFDAVPAGQRLFHLPHRPIQQVASIVLDGRPLLPSEYHVNHENGWLTVGDDVASELRVSYTVSSKLDMAITNWDSHIGNYVYYNQLVVLGDANCDGRLDFGDINPFVLLMAGGYHQQFPDCDAETFCDMNQDGKIDFGDINPFVAALVNP